MAYTDMPIVVANESQTSECRPTAYSTSKPTNWVDVNTDATVADNGGSSVIAPASITRTEVKRLVVGGNGNYVAIRAKYVSGQTLTTDPVVQVIGLDGNNIPQRLQDSSGTFEVTLADAATDVGDGTNEFSDEKLFDVRGNQTVIVVIKTAAVASSGAVAIQARLV